MMSMCGYFRTASDQQIDALAANPDAVEEFIDEGTISSLSSMLTDPPAGSATAVAAETTLSIDKSWHGIHFLLTGCAWEAPEPLCYIIDGGQEIGDDLGYGPARALSAQQVRDFAAALVPIDEAEIANRFDADALADNEIYSVGGDDMPEETLEYLTDFYVQLKAFVSQAAADGNGMIVFLS